MTFLCRAHTLIDHSTDYKRFFGQFASRKNTADGPTEVYIFIYALTVINLY